MQQSHGEGVHGERVVYRMPPKMAFLMGILSGITVASLLAAILAFAQLAEYNDEDTVATADTGVVAGVEDTQPTAAAADAAPTVDIVLRDSDHILGDPQAPVTLVEYSDFECPYCARHIPTVEQIMQDYDGQVKLVFRNFPLTSLHEYAQKAAEAAECAGAQDAFWEMHDKLFAMNEAGTMSIDNFKAAAGELGLNQSKFDTCLDSGQYTQYVQDQFAEGSQLGVQGTPATFVNGQLVSGAVPYASLASIIDSML